ncbi:MAG: LCP family protein [Anaerolineae bacterium]|nr:LCP family protein [Anaerolineae bacterium]MDW8068189.1 LCP family protein [Anaerolineae bacterium]
MSTRNSAHQLRRRLEDLFLNVEAPLTTSSTDLWQAFTTLFSEEEPPEDTTPLPGPDKAIRELRPARVQRPGLWAITAASLLLLGLLTMGGNALVHGRAPMGASVFPSDFTATPSPTSPRLTATLREPSPAPTATPFVPPTPSPSPTPTSTPTPYLITPSPFPTPMLTWQNVLSTPIPIPTPVIPVPVASDAINIVVLGSDRRPHWSEWHTDAIHVVSVQMGRPAVSIISIPRDLYVYIPNFWMSRINFADYYGEAYGYPGGGTALLRDTLLYNLGIRADYFVRTDFDGLIGIVDLLGGVEIPVHCPISDYWPYPDENGQYPILTLEPGMHSMDGETALWYARSRRTTSVFSRERRQQQVLQAIWRKARTTGVLQEAPALWEQVRQMVVTDLPLSKILDLAQVALRLEEQNVRFYNIGPDMVIPWTTPYGGHVFLPQWEKIEPMLAEAMAPMPEARLERRFTLVEVRNGTPHPDWDRLAADRLVRAGFLVVIGPPERQDIAQTSLVVFREHPKGTGLEPLQEMLGIPDQRVTYEPDPQSPVGIRLILGADYQTCPWP